MPAAALAAATLLRCHYAMIRCHAVAFRYYTDAAAAVVTAPDSFASALRLLRYYVSPLRCHAARHDATIYTAHAATLLFIITPLIAAICHADIITLIATRHTPPVADAIALRCHADDYAYAISALAGAIFEAGC